MIYIRNHFGNRFESQIFYVILNHQCVLNNTKSNKSMKSELRDNWLRVVKSQRLKKGRLHTLSFNLKPRNFDNAQNTKRLNIHMKCTSSMQLLASYIISLNMDYRIAYHRCKQCERLNCGWWQKFHAFLITVNNAQENIN